VLKRAAFGSLAQPGFHRFWRVYNPAIGYPLFRLYVALGGNRNRAPATLGVFLWCGFLHDVIVMILKWHWSIIFVVAYFCFALLSLLSLKLQPVIRQDKWPTLVNVMLNIILIAAPIQSGIWLNGVLHKL
jgi:D-alanyl-lipoteichoic acid acyltransferase DltB (MBOAT superfamily)